MQFKPTETHNHKDEIDKLTSKRIRKKKESCKMTTFNTIINNEFKMELAAIAAKYKTGSQEEMDRLRIDIFTTGRLTDPIYLTSDNLILDGLKRLTILKELYEEGFKLVSEPVIIVAKEEEQEDIYISKNVMVKQYTKSWLAVLAAENKLESTRRIAAARKGIKQTEGFNACDAAGLAFGVSGKFVQQADVVLKSKNGSFFREKIRIDELSVNGAYEIVKRELSDIENDMIKNNKTYQQAKNSFQRNEQYSKQHEKYQERQEIKNNNQLEYQKEKINISSVKVKEEVSDNIINLPSSKFIGTLSNDLPEEFINGLEELIKIYIPGSQIFLISDRLKLQKLVHENDLEYTGILEVA